MKAKIRPLLITGRALGVGSTPTFSVDGQPVVIERWNDLETAIQAALNH